MDDKGRRGFADGIAHVADIVNRDQFDWKGERFEHCRAATLSHHRDQLSPRRVQGAQQDGADKTCCASDGDTLLGEAGQVEQRHPAEYAPVKFPQSIAGAEMAAKGRAGRSGLAPGTKP